MDLSETEVSPSFDLPAWRVAQRVVLQELKTESDDEGCNGNVQLRYMTDGHDPGGFSKNFCFFYVEVL